MKENGKPGNPEEMPPDGNAEDDYSALLKSVSGLVESIQELNQQAVQLYTPVVEAILRSHSRDTKRIENTLDGLFDFCGYEPVLALFKRLCRYYYDLNPAATVDYINRYREYWDSDTEVQP